MKTYFLLLVLAGYLSLPAYSQKSTAVSTKAVSMNSSTDISVMAKQRFKVSVDRKKIVSKTNNNMKVTIAPVLSSQNAKMGWRNFAVILIESMDGPLPDSRMPAGIYLVQKKGNTSKFYGTDGKIFGESVIVSKEAKQINVGWATIDFDMWNGPCVSYPTKKENVTEYICPPNKN